MLLAEALREMGMPNNSVALVLTFAEAGALFETANLSMTRKTELGMPPNKKAIEALKKDCDRHGI